MSDKPIGFAGSVISALPATVLKTLNPCCQREVRLIALHSIPRETYSRTCRACGQRWEIERRTARETPTRRVDVLDWTED